jgi:hypothetical protein
MTTFQRILIIALIAQMALITFVFWPRPAVNSTGEPLLGALKTSDVTGMTITDDKGVSTKLVKQGDSWVAPDAANYPVDASKVTPVLDKLVAIKAGQAIAKTVASQGQLQVADNKFVRKIDLTKADGSTQTVYLGSQAGGSSVHARLAGKNEVYLANGPATWEANADLLSWINPVYLGVNASDVTGLSLKNKNGEFALTKDAQGQWQLAGLGSGETLDANKATALVIAATSIRMTKPLGKTEDPAWGLEQPTAVVTMQVKSGDQTKPVTLTIGSQDAADTSYVVKSSESEYYVRVADTSVQDFVSRDKAAFLAAAPAPQSSPAPAFGATPTP